MNSFLRAFISTTPSSSIKNIGIWSSTTFASSSKDRYHKYVLSTLYDDLPANLPFKTRIDLAIYTSSNTWSLWVHLDIVELKGVLDDMDDKFGHSNNVFCPLIPIKTKCVTNISKG